MILWNDNEVMFSGQGKSILEANTLWALCFFLYWHDYSNEFNQRELLGKASKTESKALFLESQDNIPWMVPIVACGSSYQI